MSGAKRLYFIAIVFDEPVRSELHAFKLEFRERFGCTVALKAPAHITLWPPVNLLPEEASAVMELLAAFCRQAQPFPVRLHDFGCFAPRVIFAAVEDNPALLQLQQRLSDALCAAVPALAQHRDPRPFHPHATVANRDLDVTAFETAWNDFSTRSYEAATVAAQLTLLRHNGKDWDELAQYALGKNEREYLEKL